MVWLFLALVEASPTTTRLVILLVLPTYAILAGGSPSAVRAALMGSIYLGARLPAAPSCPWRLCCSPPSFCS